MEALFKREYLDLTCASCCNLLSGGFACSGRSRLDFLRPVAAIDGTVGASEPVPPSSSDGVPCSSIVRERFPSGQSACMLSYLAISESAHCHFFLGVSVIFM